MVNVTATMLLAYSFSKGALLQFTKALAAEWAKSAACRSMLSRLAQIRFRHRRRIRDRRRRVLAALSRPTSKVSPLQVFAACIAGYGFPVSGFFLVLTARCCRGRSPARTGPGG